MVYYKYYVFNTLKGNCVSIIVYLIYLQIFFFFLVAIYCSHFDHLIIIIIINYVWTLKPYKRCIKSLKKL